MHKFGSFGGKGGNCFIVPPAWALSSHSGEVPWLPAQHPCGAGAGAASLLHLGGLVISFPKPWGVYLAPGGRWIRSIASQPHSVCS